jgi:hypothetical protein
MISKSGSASAASATAVLVVVTLFVAFTIGLVAVSAGNGGDNGGTDNVNYDFDNEVIQGSLGIGTTFTYSWIDDNGDLVEEEYPSFTMTIVGQSGSYYLYEFSRTIGGGSIGIAVAETPMMASHALIHKSTGEFFPSAPAGEDSINYNGEDISLGVWKQTCKAEFEGRGMARSAAQSVSTAIESEIIISSGQDGIPYKVAFYGKNTTEYSEYGGSYYSTTTQTMSWILVDDDIAEPEEYTQSEEIGTGYVYNESLFGSSVHADVTYLCVADCQYDQKARIYIAKMNGTLANVGFGFYDNSKTIMEEETEWFIDNWGPPGSAEIDTVFGTVLCDLYESDEWYSYKAYIGADDGILYLLEIYKDGELVDSRVLIGII